LSLFRQKNEKVLITEFTNSIKNYFDYQDFLNSKGCDVDTERVVFRSREVEYPIQSGPNQKLPIHDWVIGRVEYKNIYYQRKI